jgi:hypothetical protein
MSVGNIFGKGLYLTSPLTTSLDAGGNDINNVALVNTTGILGLLAINGKQYPLPTGLFITTVGSASNQWKKPVGSNYYQATESNISSSLLETSVIHCTLQTNAITNDYIADQETHWLISALPSTANNGSITFVIAGDTAPTYPDNLIIAWSVTSF